MYVGVCLDFLVMYLRKIVGFDFAHQQYHDNSNSTYWHF